MRDITVEDIKSALDQPITIAHSVDSKREFKELTYNPSTSLYKVRSSYKSTATTAQAELAVEYYNDL